MPGLTRPTRLSVDASKQVLIDGDKVALAWNGVCTKPDGEVLELYGIEIFRVCDGRIVDIWNSKEWPSLWQTSPPRPLTNSRM